MGLTPPGGEGGASVPPAAANHNAVPGRRTPALRNGFGRTLDAEVGQMLTLIVIDSMVAFSCGPARR